jgi:hypothetical protein
MSMSVVFRRGWYHLRDTLNGLDHELNDVYFVNVQKISTFNGCLKILGVQNPKEWELCVENINKDAIIYRFSSADLANYDRLILLDWKPSRWGYTESRGTRVLNPYIRMMQASTVADSALSDFCQFLRANTAMPFVERPIDHVDILFRARQLGLLSFLPNDRFWEISEEQVNAAMQYAFNSMEKLPAPPLPKPEWITPTRSRLSRSTASHSSTAHSTDDPTTTDPTAAHPRHTPSKSSSSSSSSIGERVKRSRLP